MQITEVR